MLPSHVEIWEICNELDSGNEGPFRKYIDSLSTNEMNERYFAEGYTLLHLAVLSGKKELVSLLYGKGVNINATREGAAFTNWVGDSIGRTSGETPIHVAARLGDDEMYFLLKRLGADMLALCRVTGEERNVYDAAVQGKSPKIIDDAQKETAELRKSREMARQEAIIEEARRLFGEIAKAKHKSGHAEVAGRTNSLFDYLKKHNLDASVLDPTGQSSDIDMKRRVIEIGFVRIARELFQNFIDLGEINNVVSKGKKEQVIRERTGQEWIGIKGARDAKKVQLPDDNDILQAEIFDIKFLLSLAAIRLRGLGLSKSELDMAALDPTGLRSTGHIEEQLTQATKERLGTLSKVEKSIISDFSFFPAAIGFRSEMAISELKLPGSKTKAQIAIHFFGEIAKNRFYNGDEVSVPDEVWKLAGIKREQLKDILMNASEEDLRLAAETDGLRTVARLVMQSRTSSATAMVRGT